MASSTSCAAVWAAHKAALQSGSPSQIADSVAAHFSAQANVSFITTGLTATSIAAIQQLLKKQAANFRSGSEELISSVHGQYVVAEESIFRTVHDQVIHWLLPEVKPTNRQIAFPMTTFASFDADKKIVSLRIYWDQGSVMRQIRLLPDSLYCKGNNSETTLPVIGPKITDLVAKIPTPQGPEIGQEVLEQSPHQAAQAVEQDLSSANAAKGTAAVPVSDNEKVKTADPVAHHDSNASRSALNSNTPQVFAKGKLTGATNTGEAISVSPDIKSKPGSIAAASQISKDSGGKSPSEPRPADLPPTSQRNMLPVFDRPSTRVQQHPGGRSSNIFSYVEQQQNESILPTTSRSPRMAVREIASDKDLKATLRGTTLPLADHMDRPRPSSRVLGPPGGTQSFSLG